MISPTYHPDITNPIQNSFFTNSPYYHFSICNSLNYSNTQTSYIFNIYIFNICYTVLTYHYTCYKTVYVELLFIKNQEFTDIESNENIDLLQNDRNFETLYLPK